MDSITQILLGSAVAAGVAPKKYHRRAIITGAVLGTLPDLDIFLKYANDVDNFTHHRGFSHSLLVLPVVSLLLLPLLTIFYPLMSRQRTYILIALSLLTHPLLDALTTYGTQLFWPIPVTPTFISSVFIIDPLYSIWLLLGIIAYWLSLNLSWLNTTGLIVSTCYLATGIVLQFQANQQLIKYYPQTISDQWYVGAVTASPFCWRGIYKMESEYTEVIFNILRPEIKAIKKYEILSTPSHSDTESLKRLLWFNPNYTVVRSRNNKLISSDLRMGEFGRYGFEFIIKPDIGKRLPIFAKPSWQALYENKTAVFYSQNTAEYSFPKHKLFQFMRCLQGDI